MRKKIAMIAAAAVLLAAVSGCIIDPGPVEVDVTLTSEIDSYDIAYANFVFNFNQDVTVDSVHVILPGYTAPYEVPDIAGGYAGDTDNEFRIYWLEGDEYVVLEGTYTVRFWGIADKTGEEFDVAKDVIY